MSDLGKRPPASPEFKFLLGKSKMARTPEEDTRTRRVLVVRPVHADDRRSASLVHPVSVYDSGG
jgi:hypothetical protein